MSPTSWATTTSRCALGGSPTTGSNSCARTTGATPSAGILMAIVASMVVQRTERGDLMFLTSATRHAQHALDLRSAGLCSSTPPDDRPLGRRCTGNAAPAGLWPGSCWNICGTAAPIRSTSSRRGPTPSTDSPWACAPAPSGPHPRVSPAPTLPAGTAAARCTCPDMSPPNSSSSWRPTTCATSGACTGPPCRARSAHVIRRLCCDLPPSPPPLRERIVAARTGRRRAHRLRRCARSCRPGGRRLRRLCQRAVGALPAPGHAPAHQRGGVPPAAGLAWLGSGSAAWLLERAQSECTLAAQPRPGQVGHSAGEPEGLLLERTVAPALGALGLR